MGTTYSLTREPVGTAPIAAPATPISDSPGSTSLAELLVEVGSTIDALPSSRFGAVGPQIAAVTAHLVDGTHEAGADGGLFTPSRETVTTLSLRTLGRLAGRTAGHEVRIAGPRAQRIRDLIADLAA
jgi:hypothetical protein